MNNENFIIRIVGWSVVGLMDAFIVICIQGIRNASFH